MFKSLRVCAGAAFLLALSVVSGFFGFAPVAQAGIYITGSYGMDSTNVPLEVTNTQSASASVDVDIFSFLRVGVSYGLETSYSLGYRARAASAADPSAPVVPVASAQIANPCPSETSCTKVVSNSKVIQKGAGLTLILWHGDMVMPYVMAGALIKTYVFKSTQDGVLVQDLEEKKGEVVPNVGAGIGFRLSKDFSLKASITASPGKVLRPGDTQLKVIWDRKTAFGLSYQI